MANLATTTSLLLFIAIANAHGQISQPTREDIEKLQETLKLMQSDRNGEPLPPHLEELKKQLETRRRNGNSGDAADDSSGHPHLRLDGHNGDEDELDSTLVSTRSCITLSAMYAYYAVSMC